MDTIKKSAPARKDGNLLQMAKAIYDEVQSSVKSQVEEAESKLLVRVGKMFEREITDRLEKEFSKRLPLVQAQHKKELSVLRQVYEKKLETLQKAYEAGQEQIKSLLQNLPAPYIQFSVPEKAIEIKQLPSQVMVSVPENAIEVKQLPSQVSVEVKPADVQPVINLPEQKSIIQMPEQAAPVVNVSVPPPRLVKKTFEYSQHGQPLTVMEEEIKDDKESNK